MTSDIMKIEQILKKYGTKNDRIQYCFYQLCFLIVAMGGVMLTVITCDVNQYIGLTIGAMLGYGSFALLFIAVGMSDLERNILKRNGIKSYSDEDLAELEERIRCLENDKSRRYD